MYKKKKILSLIPARGGSKGIPRKNIRPLLGKPLIAWTIEEAKKSKYIDRIVVSTDDEEIAKVSRKYGAAIPFIRPKELATDEAKNIDVVLHAIDLMKKNGEAYDILTLLQPTSPFRTNEDIDNAVELLFRKNAGAVISVCETLYSPYQINTLPPDRCMRDFIKQEHMNKNRQEFDTFYIDDGSIYLGYWDYIQKQKGFFGDKTFAYVIPQDKALDINSEIDFKLAEVLMKEAQ